MRWTVDEKDDLKVIKNIFNNFYPRINFSWKEVIKLWKNKPYLFSANKKFARDSGIKKSQEQKKERGTHARLLH